MFNSWGRPICNLNTAVSRSNLAFSSLLFLYSILPSEGLCPSWPVLYKYLWFQNSLEMPRKQDCRWCALCTVHRLYQNGLEFQGNTVPCTCTNVTSFMPVHEKYDLPYNNFHGSHKWSRGAKVDNVQHAASHIQKSVSHSHSPLLQTQQWPPSNSSTTTTRNCTFFQQHKCMSEASG
jgi:hypothetical protein